MAGEELLFSIPEQAVSSILTAVMVLKALGWAIIIYIVFAIGNMIINWIKAKEAKKIGRDIEEIRILLGKISRKK